MTKTDAPAHHHPAVMPSDVDGRPSFFDRFATLVSGFASRAYFFTACLLIVVLWLPSYFLLTDLNTQTRAEAALQQKLNAIADALADLMRELSEDHPSLAKDRRELAEAVGLEQRESA